MNESKHETTTEKFFAFDKVALILGFIIDTITLASILLSLKLNSGNISLSKFISPWLALSLWVLGEYIYFALLHSFWQKHINKENFQPKFSEFITKDLIQGFRNPFLSFLGLVSLITLIWIASSDEIIAGILSTLGLLVGIGWLANGMTNLDSVKVSESRKKQIDTNWEFLTKRIKNKLTRKQWVSVSDLEDIALLWEADSDDMAYILAKYASENPNGITFGVVYSREDDEKVSGHYSVLINLKNLNLSKYYYTG